MAPKPLLFVLSLTVLISFLVTSTQGSPVTLSRRGKANILSGILEAIGVFTKDKKSDAWDFKANSQMCDVFFRTKDGGNCEASVECQNGGHVKYPPKDWNACYVGGRQDFTDPRIGRFSITFTQKDGYEGEGLTNPILQVDAVRNGAEMPVTALAKAREKAIDCEAGLAPLNCHEGPWVCHFVSRGNNYIQDSRTKQWSCGIPVLGASFPKDTNWEQDLRGLRNQKTSRSLAV